jgi:hypothetical protein
VVAAGNTPAQLQERGVAIEGRLGLRGLRRSYTLPARGDK